MKKRFAKARFTGEEASLTVCTVTLSEAKGLSRAAARCFAALSMTGLDLAVAAELSRAFEPCLTS